MYTRIAQTHDHAETDTYPQIQCASRNPGPQAWTSPAAPGDYGDPLADAPQGPAFTLRPKHVDPHPDMKPGPGTTYRRGGETRKNTHTNT
jgi:hypothetical protein